MLTDREKVLYYKGSREIDFKIKEGDTAGDFVKEAMKSGKSVVEVIPKDFLGAAFKSYMIPTKEGNSVIGSIAIGKSLSKKNSVTNENLNSTAKLLGKLSEEQKTFDDFKNDLSKYIEVRTRVIELAKANNYENAAKTYNSEMATIRTSMLEKLDKCIQINEKSAEAANLNNMAQFNKVRNAIIIYTTIAFLIIIFMAYMLGKNIINPLNKIKDLAQRLAAYDFSTPIIITRKDEFGQTGTALNYECICRVARLNINLCNCCRFRRCEF